MKILLPFLCLVGLGLAIQANPWDVPAEFMEFIQKYNKTYSPQEFQTRAAIFSESLATIKQMNENAKENGLSTRFGITKFADLTREEFSAKYLGYKKISNIKPVSTPQEAVQALPKSFDWRPKGAVTKVKNQEQCGSCWAFSATEGVESAYFLAKKKLFDLSPQQIVSCDNNDDGCDGGDLPTAFAYVQQNGLETDAAYPYTSGGGDTGTCNYNPSDVVVHISGFKYATTTGNETEMQVALQNHGPLSVCVDASTWQYYEGGVIKSGCGDSLDHCVQIVGWSVTDDSQHTPYWIVRNSWGTDWGLSGYLWVLRGKGNSNDECGISDEATYVTI